MSTTLIGNIASSSRCQFQSSINGITYAGSPLVSFTKSFTSTDITKLYYQTALSVTTSATNLDLTSLTDAFGNAIVFATVKHIQILNDGTHILSIGGGTNGLFTAIPNLTAGGNVCMTTNITVDGTHKILSLISTGGTNSVELLIVGV